MHHIVAEDENAPAWYTNAMTELNTRIEVIDNRFTNAMTELNTRIEVIDNRFTNAVTELNTRIDILERNTSVRLFNSAALLETATIIPLHHPPLPLVNDDDINAPRFPGTRGELMRMQHHNEVNPWLELYRLQEENVGANETFANKIRRLASHSWMRV